MKSMDKLTKSFILILLFISIPHNKVHGVELLVKASLGDEYAKYCISSEFGVEESNMNSGLDKLGYSSIPVPENSDLDEVISYLLENGMEYVEVDEERYAYEESEYNSLYLKNALWAMAKIKIPYAWSLTNGNNNVLVAILDSGIDNKHPAVRDRLVSGFNCVTNTGDLDDDTGHGTHCAGTVVGISEDFMGAAPDCRVLPIKVLAKGKGFSSWIAKGIVYAVDSGAKVISMSLGSKKPSRIELDAIDYANSKGAIVIAAAGNNGSSDPEWPASYENVLSVAASDECDNRAEFSNYGPTVQVAAPGDKIYSTVVGGFGFKSGTSMATPYVSALGALIYSLVDDINPEAVRELICSNSDPIGDWVCYGRVNYARTIDNLCQKYLPEKVMTPFDVSLITGASSKNLLPEIISTSTENIDNCAEVKSVAVSNLGQKATIGVDFSLEDKRNAMNQLELQIYLVDPLEINYEVFLYDWYTKTYNRIKMFVPISSDSYRILKVALPRGDKYYSAEGKFKIQFSATDLMKKGFFSKIIPKSFQIKIDMIRIVQF